MCVNLGTMPRSEARAVAVRLVLVRGAFVVPASHFVGNVCDRIGNLVVGCGRGTRQSFAARLTLPAELVRQWPIQHGAAPGTTTFERCPLIFWPGFSTTTRAACCEIAGKGDSRNRGVLDSVVQSLRGSATHAPNDAPRSAIHRRLGASCGGFPRYSTERYRPMKSPFSSGTPSLRRIAYASVR